MTFRRERGLGSWGKLKEQKLFEKEIDIIQLKDAVRDRDTTHAHTKTHKHTEVVYAKTHNSHTHVQAHTDTVTCLLSVCD